MGSIENGYLVLVLPSVYMPGKHTVCKMSGVYVEFSVSSRSFGVLNRDCVEFTYLLGSTDM